MSMTCTICKHEKRAEIEAALVQRVSLRDIARQFLVSKDAASRHQNCMAEVLEAGRKALAVESAINVDEELVFCRDKTRMLTAACFDWLTDPTDSTKLYLGPRAEDVEVIYLVGDSEKKERKKAKLSELLQQVETGLNISVVWSETKYADPRELLIKASSALGNHMKTYHGFKQQAELENLRQEIDQIKSLLQGQKE